VKKWLGMGWNITLRHKHAGVVLFVYRLLWGFFLYRLADSVVTPVLARYPDLHPNADAIPLFIIETQFRLLRTDMMDSLLWLLLGLLCIRLIITPVINAGLFYSFFHAGEGKTGTQVLSGIRQVWKPVLLLHFLENALILLPAVFLLAKARNLLYATGSAALTMQKLLPYAAGWLIWLLALHLLFRCLQFGAASRLGLKTGFIGALRQALPLLGITLLMAGIGLAVSAAISASAYIWSGFAAVLIHQASHLIRTLLTLWTAASQFAIWKQQAG
jgi:hypothetical protein